MAESPRDPQQILQLLQDLDQSLARWADELAALSGDGDLWPALERLPAAMRARRHLVVTALEQLGSPDPAPPAQPDLVGLLRDILFDLQRAHKKEHSCGCCGWGPTIRRITTALQQIDSTNNTGEEDANGIKEVPAEADSDRGPASGGRRESSDTGGRSDCEPGRLDHHGSGGRAVSVQAERLRGGVRTGVDEPAPAPDSSGPGALPFEGSASLKRLHDFLSGLPIDIFGADNDSAGNTWPIRDEAVDCAAKGIAEIDHQAAEIERLAREEHRHATEATRLKEVAGLNKQYADAQKIRTEVLEVEVERLRNERGEAESECDKLDDTEHSLRASLAKAEGERDTHQMNAEEQKNIAAEVQAHLEWVDTALDGEQLSDFATSFPVASKAMTIRALLTHYEESAEYRAECVRDAHQQQRDKAIAERDAAKKDYAKLAEDTAHVVTQMHADLAASQARCVELERGSVIREEVIILALEMERKLAKHDEDRGEDGWYYDEPGELLYRLREETAELEREAGRGQPDPAAVLSEAADVANFAMMIVDNARRANKQRG